jgi:hypothetical protein
MSFAWNAEDISLPSQIGLTTTVITFTRPDGALIQSSDISIGNGYVYQLEGDTWITFRFADGVLNQSGQWTYSISDHSIQPGVIIQGQFQVNLRSPVEDHAKGLPPMKIQAFDDSCSIYTLLSPSTFETTPPETLADNWVDMTIAVNDGSNAYALWCEDVNQQYDPTQFDSTRGGVEVVLPGQSPFTSIIRSYSPSIADPNVFDNLYLSSTSGAFAANGTLLVPISEWDSTGHPVGTVYPRISTDFGQTWADVTGLPATGGPSGLAWTRACFSQNAAVMYIHKFTTGVYKSTDGGVTWNFLTNSPAFAHYQNAYANYSTPGLTQNSLRMRCSTDGNTIAMIDWSGRFYVSKDAGVTWNSIDFGIVYDLGTISAQNPGAVGAADFGMAIDGSKFLVMVAWDGPFTPLHLPLRTQNTGIWTSSDGVTWTQTPSLKLPSANINPNQQVGTQRYPSQCFLSPDGTRHVVAYTRTTGDQTTFETDASYTYGRTFVNQPVTVNLAATGGNLVAACMLPVSS